MCGMGRGLLVFLGALVASAMAGSEARALTVPSPALTCSYQGPPANTVTFTIQTGEDTLALRRAGDEIQLVSDYSYGTVRRKGKHKKIVWHDLFLPAPCNATPTVHNTDTIRVQADGDEDVDLDVSLAGGPLGPGATPEADGTSEIEIALEHLDPGERVTFVGGPESDWFRFGTAAGVESVNLNAQDEDAPDVDATMTLTPPLPTVEAGWPGAEARTGAGDDRVTTDGGPEFGGPITGSVIAMGGAGNDTLVSSTLNPFTGLNGGPGDDLIYGSQKYNVIRAGRGSDVVFGGAGTDVVELGKGHDFVDTGAGKDGIVAFDHTKDRIRCGPGRDAVARDRFDKAPGCERKVEARAGIEIFSD
jgi:Ca2+-binding RTX toxin-like protein